MTSLSCYGLFEAGKHLAWGAFAPQANTDKKFWVTAMVSKLRPGARCGPLLAFHQALGTLFLLQQQWGIIPFMDTNHRTLFLPLTPTMGNHSSH